MNPLSWKGPEFLVFFGAFSFCVILIIRGMVRAIKVTSDPHSTHILKDPYSIAFLRNAEFEVIRVCIVSLIDRGLLNVNEDKVTSTANSDSFVEKPVEKEILGRATIGIEVQDLMNNPQILSAARVYKAPLEKLGYLFEGHTKNQKNIYLAIGYIVIVGLAFAKIMIALDKNKPFLFLAAFTFFAIMGLKKLADTRLTQSGRKCLNSLETLLNNASTRISQIRKGETNELALIVAVYGIGVLPSSLYPYTSTIFARANSASFGSDGGGFSCGSSCGSSCGGGCGGGCGGCGS